MSHSLPPTIDPQAAARWQRVAPAASPWLHEEVARRMQERLQWIVKPPEHWCHWEPVRGGLQAHELLRRHYPGAVCSIYESEPARARLARRQLGARWWQPARWTGGESRFEAPAEASVGMLWSNMLLHQVADPEGLIGRWQRALCVDGYLMFSGLGPDTVHQLHRLYAAMGWPVAGQAYTDMHDWGDMLIQAGMSEPVMDMERITLTFASAERLLQELRELGRNLHPARFAGLRGKGWRRQLLHAIEEHWSERQVDGQFALTFEIVYGHAYKPEPRVRLQASSSVSLQDMRSMLGQPRNRGLR